jgi:hypothetical protein
VAGRERRLRSPLRLYLSHLFLGVPAASIVGGMGFPSVHQLAVARYRRCIALFRSLFVQGKLLAVIPDWAEFLTVLAP